MRVTDGVDVASDELLTSLPALGHQPGMFQHGDVLLDGGEAHGVEARQRRDGMIAMQGARDDVSPGGVSQRLEQPICLLLIHRPFPRRNSYNHMVVG